MRPQRRSEAYVLFPPDTPLKNTARLCLWLQHLHRVQVYKTPDFTKGTLNQTSWSLLHTSINASWTKDRHVSTRVSLTVLFIQ